MAAEHNGCITDEALDDIIDDAMEECSDCFSGLVNAIVEVDHLCRYCVSRSVVLAMMRTLVSVYSDLHGFGDELNSSCYTRVTDLLRDARIMHESSEVPPCKE